MDQTQIAANPFAMMMDPAAVMAVLARSDRLSMLKSRICRPLDKPLIARAGDDVESLDDAVEEDDLIGGDVDGLLS